MRDFSGVAQQELSQFTADAGNHVDLELVRTEAALIPRRPVPHGGVI